MKGIGQFDAMDSEGQYIGDSNAGGTSSASLPYFTQTQGVFGAPQWGITTPPFFGGGTYGSGNTPGGGNFWNALAQGFTNATSILGIRYGVPQLNPGQVITRGPGGTSFMSQAQTGGAMQTSLGAGINSSSLLLLLGIGFAVMMISRK